MASISREQLKDDIDYLDSEYLDLAYRIIRQFPHVLPIATKSGHSDDKLSFSQRWRGKLGDPNFTQEELDADPRLVSDEWRVVSGE